jgi:hypothetical protein
MTLYSCAGSWSYFKLLKLRIPKWVYHVGLTQINVFQYSSLNGIGDPLLSTIWTKKGMILHISHDELKDVYSLQRRVIGTPRTAVSYSADNFRIATDEKGEKLAYHCLLLRRPLQGHAGQSCANTIPSKSSKPSSERWFRLPARVSKPWLQQFNSVLKIVFVLMGTAT